MRNPIAGVLALAESVQTAPNAKAMSERSSELVLAAREASHLTNQLLSFERAKGTERTETMQEIDLTTLINETVTKFKSGMAPQIITIRSNVPSEPAAVVCDPLMMQEALINLLNNAVIHGGENLSEIEIVLQKKASHVEFTISDNGVGIKPEDISLVRNRFGQTSGSQGSGLGLPIAIKVVENLGGEFSFLDTVAGLTINIKIPSARYS
ncbi:hypothetical protein BFP76_00270 [Amylibacter kogurei]|uniref:histidine kinase n=2 Tax=Paramylibacter kogurei TaxID=1889778 RepID=A0A2G5K9A8_9RHOB|nr:hypothetical protein BFP76_00270 [Amylibacter kogurei]